MTKPVQIQPVVIDLQQATPPTSAVNIPRATYNGREVQEWASDLAQRVSMLERRVHILEANQTPGS